ncbi:uncharacterized protein [Chironomus tepperi]|uniref:uncharacterized protein n=1 Tax=Chironomus tepperi TaxID=113505 RepID=UPI00391F779E
MALRELHIERDPNMDESEDYGGPDDNDFVHRRRTVDERVLTPRTAQLENSLSEHLNSSVPSLDEIVIRQRGRQKKPSKISWSPIKSPFKTPTKNTLHMSLLSPSPAKKLFTNNNNNNTSMVLRNSPRKRIFTDSQNDQDPACSSTPYATPTKRLKFIEDRPMNAINPEVSLKTLLKGLSQEQLIEIISGVASKDAQLEKNIRDNLPLPDIRPYEEELCELRKNITKSSPRSRLSIQSKSDGAAYSRASLHLTAFKRALINHCKVLRDSQHFDALIDYVMMAWTYVRGLPIWDEANHNLIRKDCFKLLTLHARHSLKHGSTSLGTERIKNFRNKLKSMVIDFDELEKCKEALNAIAAKV